MQSLLQEIAEQSSNYEGLRKVNEQLDALEERAEILDKKRSGTLSNVSFINERNRKKNVYDVEKAAIVSELQALGMYTSEAFCSPLGTEQ